MALIYMHIRGLSTNQDMIETFGWYSIKVVFSNHPFVALFIVVPPGLIQTLRHTCLFMGCSRSSGGPYLWELFTSRIHFGSPQLRYFLSSALGPSISSSNRTCCYACVCEFHTSSIIHNPLMQVQSIRPGKSSPPHHNFSFLAKRA